MARTKTRSTKKAPVHWGRWITAVLILFPATLCTAVLARRLEQFNPADLTQLAFLTGAGVYLVMHLLLWKPIFMHVMGHELTHAFWAVLLGGKIKSLLVSHEGGQVTLSKSNFLIALAPYFFPLYTFMLVPIYFIAAPRFYPFLAFAIGFTLAFHVALTLHSLRDHQSDIREVGVLFSFSFIYFMNVVVMVLILALVAPGVIRLPEYAADCGRASLAVARWLSMFFYR